LHPDASAPPCFSRTFSDRARIDDRLGEGVLAGKWTHRFKMSVAEDTPSGSAYAVKKRGLASGVSLSRSSLDWQRIDIHRRLLRRHAEIVLADDIVAVEHASSQMTGHRHGHSLRDPGAHHVSGRGATKAGKRQTGKGLSPLDLSQCFGYRAAGGAVRNSQQFVSPGWLCPRAGPSRGKRPKICRLLSQWRLW
jgi:hypothetical protein